MMTLIEGLPDHVVGLLAEGKITRKDYTETVTPAVRKALERHDKVSIYYEFGSGFTGIDFGAGMEDFFLGVSHIMQWKRIVLVSEIDWINKSAQFFGHFMPAEVRVFTLAERDKAKAWAAG